MEEREPGRLLDLLEWKRAVAEMYASVRSSPPDEPAWSAFRRRRDELFRTHAQSPLDAPQKKAFRSLPCFPYDPAWRVVGRVAELSDAAPRLPRTVTLPEGTATLEPFATVLFDASGQPPGSGRLTLFWLGGYGGGLFLPFKDLTSGQETYGGGRYLFDTIKGADLGSGTGWLTLDFNYAYNPSCAYNPRWVCPLAPVENALAFRVPAGERKFS